MVDEAKNQIVPRTEMEKRMGEALSNKNWGASSTLMNQIASDTYDYEK
jgi:epsin